MGRATNDEPQEIVMTDWQISSAPKKMGQPVFSLDGKKPGNNHYGNGGNLLSLGGEVSGSGAKASRDLQFPPSVTLLNLRIKIRIRITIRSRKLPPEKVKSTPKGGGSAERLISLDLWQVQALPPRNCAVLHSRFAMKSARFAWKNR